MDLTDVVNTIIEYGTFGNIIITFCSKQLGYSDSISLDAPNMIRLLGGEDYFKIFSTFLEGRIGSIDFPVDNIDLDYYDIYHDMKQRFYPVQDGRNERFSWSDVTGIYKKIYDILNSVEEDEKYNVILIEKTHGTKNVTLSNLEEVTDYFKYGSGYISICISKSKINFRYEFITIL